MASYRAWLDWILEGWVTPNVAKMKAGHDVQGLIRALRYPDSRFRAAEALQRVQHFLANRKRFIPITLQDSDAQVRSAAAAALGDTGDVRAVEPLITALSDNDYNVRWRAALALGCIGDARAVEPLIDALSHDSTAAVALGRISDARAVEPLITALHSDGERMRESAARALGCIGDTRAIEPLIHILNDSKTQVRLAAVEALERIGGARSVEALIGYALHFDYRNAEYEALTRVRSRTIEALGHIGDAQAVEPLTLVLLEDSDLQMRWAAARSLKLINDPRSKTVLQVILKMEGIIPDDEGRFIYENLPRALACIAAGKDFNVVFQPSQGHYEWQLISREYGGEQEVRVEESPASCEIICCEADPPSGDGAPIAPAEEKGTDA